MESFRNSVQRKISQQLPARENEVGGGGFAQGTAVPLNRLRRRLEPAPPIGGASAPAGGACDSFRTAAKKSFEGVPGMIHTIHTIQEKCQKAHYNEAFEELQVLIFQDTECPFLDERGLTRPSLRASEKTQFLQELLEILAKSNSAGMDNKVKLVFFELIKRFASDTVQRSSSQTLFSSAEERIFGPLHEHSAMLEAKLLSLATGAPGSEASYHYEGDCDVFLIDKILYNVEAAKSLLSSSIQFVKARNDKGKGNKITELFARIGGAATLDGECIGWLVAHGLKFAWQTATGAPSNRTAAQILVIEKYNDIILKQPDGVVFVEQAKLWIADLGAILSSKFSDLRPQKDWLIAYACVECLLNIAFRFPEAQQGVVDVLSKPLVLKLRSSLNPITRVRKAWDDTSDFQRRIKFKYVEALAQLALWGQDNIRAHAANILDEHRSKGAPVSNNLALFWRFILAQNPGRYSEILCIPAAADFMWVETAVVACKNLFMKEPLREANAILGILNQEFGRGGTVDINAGDLVRYIWTHVPLEIIQEIEDVIGRLSGGYRTPEVCKRLFMRTLMLAFSCKLKSIRAPDHLGMAAAEQSSGSVPTELSSDQVLAEDIVAFGGTESAGGSDQASVSSHDSVVAPLSNASGNSSLDEVMPEVSAEQLAKVHESIRAITEHIKRGSASSSGTGLRNVIVVGVTGSGKSTMVNSLAGCTIRTLDPEEAEAQYAPADALKVVPMSEGGAKDPVTVIGNHAQQSETEVLRAIEICEENLDESFMLWDAPGFLDSHGPEINIANAVNLSNLLKASQQDGLIVVVVLDAPSFTASKGAALKDTVKILVHLLGDEEDRLDNSFLSGTLFCVTKAPEGSYPLRRLREWIVRAGLTEGLDLEGHREQISIFDPLKRNSEGCGPLQLRKRLMSMRPLRKTDKVFETSLTDADTNLLSKIAHILSLDVASSLEKCDFETLRRHLDLFNSLQVISNRDIKHFSDIVFQSIEDRVTKWSYVLTDQVNKYTLAARKEVRRNLDKLKQAQVLEDAIPPSFKLSVKALYTQCYDKVQQSERDRQASETQELESMFTKSKANLRTALIQRSETTPDFFSKFDVSKWDCKDCVREYASVDQVQDLKKVLDKAGKYAAGRMPDQLYVFGEQGNPGLSVQLHSFQSQVLKLFQEAQHKSRGTVLDRKFASVFSGLQEEIREELDGGSKEEIDFFSKAALLVSDVPSLEIHGMDPSAANLYSILMELQQGHAAIYERRASQLEEYFQEVHAEAVDLRISGVAKVIEQRQDAFKSTVEGDMKKWVDDISSGGKDFLRAQLRILHSDYDALWSQVLAHTAFSSVSEVQRGLRTREKKVLDEIVLSADAYVNHTAAEINDTELKIQGKLEQLEQQSFEVVKLDYPRLMRRRISVANLMDLKFGSFGRELVTELARLLQRMAEIDAALHATWSAEVDAFLEQLMQTATAENAAVELTEGFASFEDDLRSQLPDKASLIEEGKLDMHAEMMAAVSEYHAHWDTLRSRCEISSVGDRIKRLEREERALATRLKEEAAQFLRNLASDRKQRDLKFEDSFMAIKQELEKVVREHYSSLMAVNIEAVSELAKFGFSRTHVAELSSILAILETDDPPTYAKRSKNLKKFYSKLREVAEAWHHAAAYRKGVADFCEAIRSAIYDKAPVLAPGGKIALEEELDSAFPKHQEHWNALVEGPQAHQPMVKKLAVLAEEEKETLMLQLERELSNHVKNLLAARKQGHQEFGALVLKLRGSSEAVEQHCDALAACSMSVDNIQVLCKHGFDTSTVHEIERLLQYFYEKDKAIYPRCEAELLQALNTIQGTASDLCADRLKSQALVLLEENKTCLLKDIDTICLGIVEGSVKVENELMTDAIAVVIAKLVSLETQRSRDAKQRIDTEVTQTAESVRGSAKERWQMLEQLAKTKRREAITTRMASLITQLSKHQEQDQLDLAKAMDELLAFDGRSPEYLQMADAVKAQLDALQDYAEIQRMLGSQDFLGLNARCQMLFCLRELLQEHFQVTMKIDKVVAQEMSSLLAEVDRELDADLSSSTFLQFSRLRYFCVVYEAVRRTFSNLPQIRQQLVDAAINKMNQMLIKARDMVRKAEETRSLLDQEAQKSIAKLLIKGYGVSFELQFVEKFKNAVQNYVIAKCVPKEQYQIGMALMEYATDHPSEDDGVKEMANVIIDTFPAFKSFNIALFNAKAGGVTFSEALAKLHCEGPSDHTALKQAYDSYFQEYDIHVNQIVKKLDEYPREQVKSKIQECSKGLAGHASRLGDKLTEFGRLLGLVCGLWTYLSCRGRSSGLEKVQVLQPHSTQVLGILRLLGLDQSSGLSNHLIQIDTGEGKSIALGFAATLLALLGFRVDVVCYSRYLSERDRQAFLALFNFLDVEKRVSYSDFEQLSSRIMKDGTLDFPDMRQVFLHFLQGKKYKHTPKQQGRSVLLMDEVDVFFSDAFYGMTYNPTANLDTPEAHQLVKFVWKNRGRMYDCDAHVEELLASSEAKKLQKTFPNLNNKLLKVQFRKLLQAVKLFPVSGSPRLDGMHQYVLDKKEQRIGYLDPVSGVPNTSWSYGYITSFTYLHCVENKQLELEKVKTHITMQLDCGSLLYSRIPTFYTVCLGMTGTLDCLSAVQNDLLKQFGFKVRTRLPSTFKKGVLNEKEKPEDVSTVVEVGSYDEYFETLKREIERQVRQGRATLIVFEDQSRLEKFKQNIKLRQPNLKQYQTPKVLSDQLPTNERDYVVIQAIRRFATTFMTRSYGRGTDFVCRDDGLVKNGGVHLIVTFYPQDESENKQINGRTCRQDNPGSARKILFEEDLKHLDATETDMAGTGLSWDAYLAKKREQKEAERYRSMEESERNSTQNHNNTLQACEAVKNGQFDVAAVVFQKFGEDRYQALADRFKPMAGAGICRLMCLSDATGSMEGLWASALESINTVLERIARIADGKGIIEIKWVAFRDYDTTVLEESSWTQDATSLAAFLGRVVCNGGADFEEAIDCALHCANHEPKPPTQVLLIGDAPPHTEKPGEKLSGCEDATLLYDYRAECRHLQSKGIPVHTFAIGDNERTMTAFKEIANLTDGQFQQFSVENLLDVLCLQALEQMGGAELTKRYKSEYMGLAHT